MPINFDSLIDEATPTVTNPRDIFLTLSGEFAHLRAEQSDVLDKWFEAPDRRDSVIKLNVGSGKTLVGLLILKSCLSAGVGPAVYVAPDNFLVEQALGEAVRAGIAVTDDEKDSGFRSGEKILIINVHKLFNGRSVFGVGGQGEKIAIGSLVMDDAHASIASISDQFRIELPSTHPAYAAILELFVDVLPAQGRGTFLSMVDGDPYAYMEVPFWAWKQHADAVQDMLHVHREDAPLKFSLPFLGDVLPLCRCFISGQRLEICPPCPPTDLVRSFANAKRRIYMTATLSDDSVLVTHFGVDPSSVGKPITASSSQGIGERMILMPQELNPNLDLSAFKELLADYAKTVNVVVIVPSVKASDLWKDIAAQVLVGGAVTSGVEKLRNGHVGLTVLVNRYDGIDLPYEACRLLVLVGLPEVATISEKVDMGVLGQSAVGLRRQMQRIEQGMGRGVRAIDDYCAVLLFGSHLTSRLLSPAGAGMLTGATRAQLDLSRKLAKQLQGGSLVQIREAIDQCLGRNQGWTKAAKLALVGAKKNDEFRFEPMQVAVRAAFEHCRVGERTKAAEKLQKAINEGTDPSEQAWLRARLAEVVHAYDPQQAQEILLKAYKQNKGVTKPIEGAGYTLAEPSKLVQAAAVQKHFQDNYLEATDRLLCLAGVLEDLAFEEDTSKEFESALQLAGAMLGLTSNRPEHEIGEGPDNLWVTSGPTFLVIECKNGSTSHKGISKSELGQLEQSMSWFSGKYGAGVKSVPVIVHPLRTLGEGASEIQGMRVMDEVGLDAFKSALKALVEGLSAADTLASVDKIRGLLNAHGLNEASLVDRFTKPIKKG